MYHIKHRRFILFLPILRKLFHTADILRFVPAKKELIVIVEQYRHVDNLSAVTKFLNTLIVNMNQYQLSELKNGKIST